MENNNRVLSLKFRTFAAIYIPVFSSRPRVGELPVTESPAPFVTRVERILRVLGFSPPIVAKLAGCNVSGRIVLRPHTAT